MGDGASVNLGTKGGAVKLLIDSVNEQLGEDKKCGDYMTVVHCNDYLDEFDV